MNKDNAKDYLPLVQALAEGETIEFRDCQGFWSGNPQVNFNAPACRYRIKPSPSCRPWTFEEVPVGAVVATERGGGRYVITAAEERDNEGYVSISLGQRDEVDTEELLANYVLLDGKPCGVAV